MKILYKFIYSDKFCKLIFLVFKLHVNIYLKKKWKIVTLLWYGTIKN